MLETVRAFRDALGLESTLAFVTVMAIIFAAFGGLLGWVVDQAEKTTLAREESRRRPPIPADLGIRIAAKTVPAPLARPSFDLISDAYDIQAGHVICFVNLLKTPTSTFKEELFTHGREHFGFVARGSPIGVECFGVPNVPEPRLELVLTVDAEVALVGLPGRHYVLQTFRMTKDRLGMPTWDSDGIQTGPVEKRPNRTVEEIIRGVPPGGLKNQ